MLEATAWSEVVFYFECPKCQEVNDLGSGVIWGEATEMQCEHCDATVSVRGPEDA